MGCGISAPTGTQPSSSVRIDTSPTAQVSATSTPSATPKESPTATTLPEPSKDARKGNQLKQPYRVGGVIVVSKKHRISVSYGPAVPTGANQLDAATAKALAKMTSAAKAAGIRILVKSGYRSYSQQNASYQRALRTQPQNINFYAPAGASEHQTGLAVDLWDGKTWYRPMEDSATGKWLHKHSHEYGFILRFPNGKQKITGVPYEPWHFRYVGVQHSKKFDAANKLTLEEYLGLA